MKLEFPAGLPGIHPPTAALTRILAQQQILNPADNKPYSEEMILGLGGGLDTGYILYQFGYLPNPILLLGFRNQWNQTREFLEKTVNRLKLMVEFHQYSDEAQAEKALQLTVKAGKPVIVWVDKASLPYRHLPESLKGMIKHQVTVNGRDARLWRLYLDDLSTGPIKIREKTFTSARGNLSESNFLVMVFEKAGYLSKNDLQKAIIEGIQECVIQLTRPIQTIGISNLNNWADKLIDRHNHLGWSQVFPDQKGLFSILCTLYEGIKLNGTEGFALRKMYSDFLHEAAGILNKSPLNALAGQYLQLANLWSNLAENALPSRIPIFDRVKKLLNKKHEAYRVNNLETFQTTTEEINALAGKIEAAFPLDKLETYQLFERLSSQVKLIAEFEMSAARRLLDVTR